MLSSSVSADLISTDIVIVLVFMSTQGKRLTGNSVYFWL